MSALLALALLVPTLPSTGPESVTFRLRPPVGEVLRFTLTAAAERLDGTTLLDAHMIVAQRARSEGANFRFTRYVAFVSATGAGPLAEDVRKLNALAGKSFPLLANSAGEDLSLKRGKYENDSDDVPSFAFAWPGPLTVGEPRKMEGDGLRPAGEATLREIRDLPGQRAAVIGIAANSPEVVGTGTLVVSVDDGMILLVDLNGEMKAQAPRPAVRVHLGVRRQNVPGLDRLAAELRLDP